MIRDGARRLREAGISNPKSEAMMLMLHAFGGSHVALISQGSEPVPKGVEDEFLDATTRRAAREPVQHIMGYTAFYGLEIRSDGRALIPRIDSETVVTAALDRLPKDQPLRLADLGTGTGCLLAALLRERPETRGVGVEASPEAARLAGENFEALGFSGRATVFQGSWADWRGWGEADMIISNPPYIASAVIEELEPEVRDHDPLSALDGGADGLDAYRQIVNLAGAQMKPGACLIFEIGYDQRAAVSELLQAAGFENVADGQDLGGNDRWVAGWKAR
nr:peptide chain release factor N(5)-glutamine methyltransferase [Hyphomonas sediminis]